MFNLRSHTVHKALIVSCLAATLSLSASQANAQPGGAPNADYYEALNGAAALKQEVNNFAIAVSNFRIPTHYCEPPLMPQKPLATKALTNLAKQKRALQRKIPRLSQLAVSASTSQYASIYDAQIKEVTDILVAMAQVGMALRQKSQSHHATPVVDCTDLDPTTTYSSIPAPEQIGGVGVPTYLMDDWTRQAKMLQTMADGIEVLVVYCLPPERPNKAQTEAEINRLLRLVQFQKNRRVMLVKHNDAVNDDTGSLYGDLIMAELTLLDKLDKLANARETDCSKSRTGYYLPSDAPSQGSKDDLKYALGNAMGNNPYSQTRAVALPVGGIDTLDVLYDAEYAVGARLDDVISQKRRQILRERNTTPVRNTANGTSVVPPMQVEQPEVIEPSESYSGTTQPSTDASYEEVTASSHSYPTESSDLSARNVGSGLSAAPSQDLRIRSTLDPVNFKSEKELSTSFPSRIEPGS